MGEKETIREKSTWNLNEPLNNNLTVDHQAGNSYIIVNEILYKTSYNFFQDVEVNNWLYHYLSLNRGIFHFELQRIG